MPGAALLLVVAGVFASAPAQADSSAYTSWVSRVDEVNPGPGTTYTQPGPDAELRLSEWDHALSVTTDAPDGPNLGATFAAPTGQTLEAGVTYRASAGPGDPTTSAGQLMMWHDGRLCGRTIDQLWDGEWPAVAATGTFHVSELERDGLGNVTRFAATYEMNCQTLGGSPGFEGSVAVNATTPASALPDVPVTPGPVTNLQAANVGPDGSGTNTTTLTWTNPVGVGDVILDSEPSEDPDSLPADVGASEGHHNVGHTSSWHDGHVEFMDTRTYRVVPRGPSGRLGPATLLLVEGSRLSIPDLLKTITIGREVQVSGRLSLSWDYVDPADVMKGPGLVGRTVVMCRQSSVHYVDGACTPVDRTKTTADGRFTLSATPMANSIYQVMVPATPRMVGNLGWVVTTHVAPQTDLAAPEGEAARARTSVRRGSVRRGSVIHFTTSRARAGSRGVVRLQRKDGHTWHTLKTKHFNAAKGKARRLAVPYRERKAGTHLYRVVKLADSRHVNGYSRLVRVRVH